MSLFTHITYLSIYHSC